MDTKRRIGQFRDRRPGFMSIGSRYKISVVFRNELYLQCDTKWKKFWEPEDLLQVPNPPCFVNHIHVAVRGAAAGRRRLNAVARSEFVVLFLTCFWDTAQGGARQARVFESGLKIDASGVGSGVFPTPFRCLPLPRWTDELLTYVTCPCGWVSRATRYYRHTTVPVKKWTGKPYCRDVETFRIDHMSKMTSRLDNAMKLRQVRVTLHVRVCYLSSL